MKKMVRMLFHRVVLVGAAILLQLALLVVMLVRFERYFVYFYAVCFLLSLVVVLGIINGRSNPGYKIAWLIPILLFPIFGGLFYLMFGQNHLSRRERKKMAPLREEVHQLLPAENPVLRQLEEESPEAANQARYIEKWAYAPLTKDSFSEFLPSGESKFERMKAELERAERFIFLEYFIIEPGVMWDLSLIHICTEKSSLATWPTMMLMLSSWVTAARASHPSMPAALRTSSSKGTPATVMPSKLSPRRSKRSSTSSTTATSCPSRCSFLARLEPTLPQPTTTIFIAQRPSFSYCAVPALSASIPIIAQPPGEGKRAFFPKRGNFSPGGRLLLPKMRKMRGHFSSLHIY